MLAPCRLIINLLKLVPYVYILKTPTNTHNIFFLILYQRIQKFSIDNDNMKILLYNLIAYFQEDMQLKITVLFLNINVLLRNKNQTKLTGSFI